MDINFDSITKLVLSVCVTIIHYLFGSGSTAITMLITFVLLDYITGVMSAIYTKQLSSEIGAKGIIKKVAIFIVVALCNILDVAFNLQGVFVTAMITVYCANEGLSILENCAKMGVQIPKKVYDVLKQLKKEDKDNENRDK